MVGDLHDCERALEGRYQSRSFWLLDKRREQQRWLYCGLQLLRVVAPAYVQPLRPSSPLPPLDFVNFPSSRSAIMLAISLMLSEQVLSAVLYAASRIAPNTANSAELKRRAVLAGRSTPSATRWA